MEGVFVQLPDLLTALWFPFCRVMALLSAAPIVGDTPVPVTSRVLLALVLAVVLMPVAQSATHVDALSTQGIVLTAEQLAIGAAIGFAFQLTIAAMMVLGFLLSSQLGLSMAVLNDPINGVASDAVSSMIYVLVMLVFFSIDGHLVLTGVLGASFHAWPVGTVPDLGSLQLLAHQGAWVFSAALLLAVPVIFSTFLVQIGFGLLNRIAPQLNLYSLGFGAVTVFGLLMFGYLLRFVPDHYIRLTDRVLDLLQQQMG